MQRKPSFKQIREYLEKYDPSGLNVASIELVGQHNHLIYKLTDEDGKRQYCLRMINPESPRAGDWITIPEEHTFLNLIDRVWLGPKSYFVDPERFILPLCIQEFVSDAVCFNDLKPLSQEYLEETAKAIAVLNSQEITPDNFPFRFTRYSYLTSIKKWRERLAVIESPDRSIYGLRGIEAIVEWSRKIKDVINQAEKILIRFEPWLQKASPHFCLNFDGAHCGNTYWCSDRKCKVIFIDWEKVSFGDPAFTLVRFLTSIRPNGEINESDKNLLLETYLKKIKKNSDFETLFKALFEQRLFERQVADFIWIVWNHVRERKTGPIERTSAAQRYQTVMKLLEEYQ